MGNESSDSECEANALRALLDSFPSVPLEFIASAYIQAHSDRELAAGIIAFSLGGIASERPSNGVSSREPDVSGSETCRKSSKSAAYVKESSHRRPLPRSRGPCPPTLEEYFPSAPEKSAWIEPLSQRLQEVTSLQNQRTATSEEMQLSVSSAEFPSLEKKNSNDKGQRLCSSDTPQPLRSRGRCMSRASAAFGLASSARSSTKGNNGNLRNALNTTDKDSPKQLKQFKKHADEAEKTSLWPTENEASLLSMLGDDFNLDIEAVRDVLGYYRGDVQKSFEVLQQMISSPSSNDQAHKEVPRVDTLSHTDSSLLTENETAGSNVERREFTKADDCRTQHSHTLQTYYAFEKAILKHDSSSMKWVVERLCNSFPHADMATLLEVLRATNFDLNDAEKMLEEAGRNEGSPGSEERKDPCQLAKTILEALFSEPQEIVVDSDKTCQKNTPRQMKKKAAQIVEVPKWKAVTSTELDMLGDEDTEQRTAPDVMPVTNVVKGFEIATAEGGRSSYGDWNDYERHQASAKQHWKTMQSYLTAASAAYASSDFHKGELLTEKGNMYKQLSLEAKERANTFLLEIKSRQSESDFTLDLQEQHISQALQLLRLHLKSFSSIPSCHTFTVVTGCYENPKSGHKKIKQEVLGYLEEKGYKWVETSPFCLQIQMRETKQLDLRGEQVATKLC